MGSDDDGPDSNVSVVIGICGVILFSITAILCMIAHTGASRHRYSKRIFGTSTVMCLLELPRCLMLIKNRDYSDQPSYIAHMVANFFFFFSFTFVCLLLYEAIDISRSSSPLKSKLKYQKSKLEMIILAKNSLYVVNFIFIILIIGASISCGSASSLFNFFRDSYSYKIYTYFDVFKNLTYSIALCYYGCKLRIRIKGFSKTVVVSVHTATTYQDSLILKFVDKRGIKDETSFYY
jgi:hypothetical protein